MIRIAEIERERQRVEAERSRLQNQNRINAIRIDSLRNRTTLDSDAIETLKYIRPVIWIEDAGALNSSDIVIVWSKKEAPREFKLGNDLVWVFSMNPTEKYVERVQRNINFSFRAALYGPN